MHTTNHERREFIKTTGLATLALAMPTSLSAKSSELLVYVGTYTNKGSKGIYVCKFNLGTGELKPFSTIQSRRPKSGYSEMCR